MALEMVYRADFYRVRQHFSSPFDLWEFQAELKIEKIGCKKCIAGFECKNCRWPFSKIWSSAIFKKKYSKPCTLRAAP